MKNLTLIALFSITAFCFQFCSQPANNQNVPEDVITAFNQKFTDVKNVKWGKENESEWEAEFKMNDKDYSANFSNSGQWMETEYKISESEVPNEIKSKLDGELTDYSIEGVEIAETGNGKSYEFEVKQGEEVFEVIIDSHGNLTKKSDTAQGQD